MNKGNYGAPMCLSDCAKEELSRWVNNVDYGIANLTHNKPDLGWGATDGITHIGGKWNEEEKIREEHYQINYLELLAIFLALRAFGSELSGVHIRVQSDNTTAVAYVSNFGGSKPVDCNDKAKEIWLWCIRRHI